MIKVLMKIFDTLSFKSKNFPSFMYLSEQKDLYVSPAVAL